MLGTDAKSIAAIVFFCAGCYNLEEYSFVSQAFSQKGRVIMHYVIGDVARTLGLTPGALHYFEREGVISPRKGNNTRRTYSAEDVIRLISYRKYRSMEMPLKEIARQFSPEGNECAEIADKMIRQQHQAEETAKRYQLLAENIAWFAGHTAAASGRMGQIDVDTLPESYVLQVGKDGFISRNREEQTRVAAWLEHMPAVRVSCLCGEDGQSRLCYSIDAACARLLGLDNTPGVALLPRCAALHTFQRLDLSYYDHPANAFSALREYALVHAFRQAGPALGISLCVECRGSERNTVLEVWLPIR